MDDDSGLRQLLKLTLETAGLDVIEAATELDLQRHLAQSRPDALIINMQRAEAEGLKLLARMRARSSLADVPIVFVAGIIDDAEADDFRRLALSKGADWFEPRPLGLVNLQNRVTELIRRGRPAQQHTRRVG